MSDHVMIENVLAVGVDPHRAKLDVVGIRFPEKVLVEKHFDNSRAGHQALLRTARAVANEHNLDLVFGLEDSGNYGYRLGRYLAQHGCLVKEVNPRMTNRQRDFYGHAYAQNQSR